MSLTIGRLARESGVGIETVRFYEREGLIAPPPRSEAGYRIFPEGVAGRIRFIQRAQELGFTLREVRELIALQEDDRTDCGRIRARAQAKLGDVEQRIADLERIKAALARLIQTCKGRGSVRACVILESFARGGTHGADPRRTVSLPRSRVRVRNSGGEGSQAR